MTETSAAPAGYITVETKICELCGISFLRRGQERECSRCVVRLRLVREQQEAPLAPEPKRKMPRVYAAARANWNGLAPKERARREKQAAEYQMRKRKREEARPRGAETGRCA